LTRVDSQGLRCRLGSYRMVDCQSDICLLVEKLDGGARVIFRYQELKSKRYALYNSNPRFHPSNDLMVWPLGSGDMLFVNIKENKYFIRATYVGARHNWRRKFLPISLRVSWTDKSDRPRAHCRLSLLCVWQVPVYTYYLRNSTHRVPTPGPTGARCCFVCMDSFK
jgi:hypothetical protein